MAAYAETSMSRRKFLLNYFGENFDEINGEGAMMDDNMKNPKPKIKVNDQIIMILGLIEKTKEQYRIKELVSYLVGEETNLLRSHNVSKNDFFGIGKNFEKVFWHSLIRHMLVESFVNKSISRFESI